MSENNANGTNEIVLSIEMSDAISAQTAEAWAVGKRGGVDVADTDPTYHNNAKYYAEQCAGAEQAAQDAEEAAAQAESAKTDAEAARDRAEAIGAGAAQSAGAAAESAQAAATAKAGAESAQTAAAGSANSAAAAATSAASSASTATGAAAAASSSETAAGQSASAAAGSATAADQSAQAAAQSAEDAQEVLDSIPEDYSQLSDDVSSLKSAINTKADAIYPSVSGSVATFPDGADGMPIKSLAIALEPIQEGSGDPSPTNVRPISGWTGCTVNRTGKNILYYTPGKLSAPLSVTLDTTRATYVKADVDYTFSFGMSNATNWRIGAILFDANGSRLFENGVYLLGQASNLVSNPSGQYYVWGSNNTVTSIKITPVYDCWVMLFWLLGDTSDSTQMTNAQMEPGSTASPYEPYHGISVQIPFGQTVYGGTLDAVAGKLTVDRVCVTATECNAVLTASTGVKYADVRLSDIVYTERSANNNISSIYKFRVNAPSDGGWFRVIPNTTYSSIYIFDNRFTDKTTANGILAVEQPQFCYLLAIPIVIENLTVSQIQTLLGVNNLFADTGNVSVEYPADTKMYIDNRINASRRLIAGIETGFVASKAYSVGDMLIIGDGLYKVASSIASGATITVGTNVTKTTVAEQLIALANA